MTLGDFVLVGLGLAIAFTAGAFSDRARAAADWTKSLFKKKDDRETPQDGGGPGPVQK
jgi:hypothetical protein